MGGPRSKDEKTRMTDEHVSWKMVMSQPNPSTYVDPSAAHYFQLGQSCLPNTRVSQAVRVVPAAMTLLVRGFGRIGSGSSGNPLNHDRQAKER